LAKRQMGVLVGKLKTKFSMKLDINRVEENKM
jgi:hypothetical protein